MAGRRSIAWVAPAVAVVLALPSAPAVASSSLQRATGSSATVAAAAAPAAPVLTVVLTGATARLTWTSTPTSDGLVTYRVFRNDQLEIETLNPFYDGTNLPAGTYTYAVDATDAAGQVSARSNSVTVTVAAAPLVDTTPPSVPGTPTTTVIGSTVGLSWAISSDDAAVAGYRVMRGGIVVGTTNDTTWSEFGLATGSYRYTVVAFDAVGNTSAPSGVATATVGAPASLAFITPSQLPEASLRQTYLAYIVADDPPGPSSFRFRLVSGKLPSGLKLVGNTLPTRPEARVTGVPTARGTWNFTIEVTDGTGARARRSFTIRVV